MTEKQSAGSEVCTREISPNESLSQTVVSAVASLSGADPIPVDGSDAEALEPLYAVVDPEALDSVFRSTADTGRAGGTITFSYHGCEVTVHEERYVTVTRLETRTGEAAD